MYICVCVYVCVMCARVARGRQIGARRGKERSRSRKYKTPRERGTWSPSISRIARSTESYCSRVAPGLRWQLYKFRIGQFVVGLPGPRSSLTCSVHSTQCAMSKYGNIFSLMTWLAMSKNASGSIVEKHFCSFARE